MNSQASPDRRSISMLFLYGFGNAATYVAARTVADSAFLSHIGPGGLPRVYLISAVMVTIVSAVYGRLFSGSSYRQSVLASLAILSISSLLVPTLIVHEKLWSLTVVYVLSQIRGSIGTIQYTLLLHRQFSVRQSRGVVGLIGLGSTLAGILVGLAISTLSERFEIATLMYLVAIADALTMLPVRLLPRTRSAPSFPETDRPVSTAGSIHHRRYAVQIASMVSVSVIAATLIEFQWKVVVADHFKSDESELASYFGGFYAAVYFATALLQAFATGRVLNNRGLVAGLCLFPAALFLSCLSDLIMKSARFVVVCVTVAKGADALKRSMTDPAIQLLYGPIAPIPRHRILTAVTGIVKPLSEAFTGLILILLMPHLTAQSISVPILILVLIWLGLILSVVRGYRWMTDSTA